MKAHPDRRQSPWATPPPGPSCSTVAIRRVKFYPTGPWIDALRWRQLSLPGWRRAPARCAHDVLLLRDRHHAGDGDGEGRLWLGLCGRRFRFANGNYLDGGKTYKVTLPGPVPAKDFWSFVVYDNQTRSLLETDQKLAGVDSHHPGLKTDADGSVTVWFSADPACRPGEQLGADHARQGVERAAASLWAAGALVRQELETGRP